MQSTGIELVENHNPVLFAEISKRRFPVLFDLRDAGEGLRCDINELVKLYLRGGLRGLVDDGVVAVEKQVLDDLFFEALTTEGNHHLGAIRFIAPA